ncbi:hypothetical protein LINPERPRIM_LOCUS40363 [Linum perenne]
MLQTSRSPADSKPRPWFRSIFPTASLILLLLFFVGSAVLVPIKKQTLLQILTRSAVVDSFDNLNSTNCEDKEKVDGSETLPQGIIRKTSNLQMRPLWGKVAKLSKAPNLYAAAVGIKQKDLVDRMVTKFLSSGFTVMLFHYDGFVDEWNEFSWSSNVIHVSARNQTKWWFAKRFMHPDIVAEYDYLFLWDEDIRVYKKGSCEGNNKAPPCTGWVEMMTPVFSRKAWRCVWYMIQNDLIHAWGLDYRLGYCAQGDRTKNIGVVDAEYVRHYGRPTLGGSSNKSSGGQQKHPHELDPRVEVRRESYNEYKMFKRRWARAAKEDKCWIDPYKV